MAIGDIGLFLPKESQFGTPGAFDKMLQAEAQKRAAYLSSMDQFYENLEEAQRQFDETLSFKTETRDLELEWARESLNKRLAFERESLAAQKEYQSGLLDLREREIGGTEEDRLSPFQSFKLFGLLEREGKSREETRESAADLIEGEETIAPGSLWEGPGTRRRSTGPSSGEVNINFSPFQRLESAADIPGGRRFTDEDYIDETGLF